MSFCALIAFSMIFLVKSQNENWLIQNHATIIKLKPETPEGKKSSNPPLNTVDGQEGQQGKSKQPPFKRSSQAKRLGSLHCC